MSKGLQLIKAWSPLVFKQRALSTLGSDERTSRVAGTLNENKEQILVTKLNEFRIRNDEFLS